MNIEQQTARAAHTAPADPHGDRAKSCVRCSDGAADMTEQDRRMLQEMAEIGMGLLRTLQQRAEDDSKIDAGEVALAYSRITRAVRLTIALKAKLADEGRVRKERDEAAEVKRLWECEEQRIDQRRDQVERLVEQAIEAEASETERDGLMSGLRERLDEDDIDAKLADRPIGEVLARICRDLGIEPEPGQWAHEVWADEAPARLAPFRKSDSSPPDSLPAEIARAGHDPPVSGSS
jgi:hypothetical protein